MKGRIAAAMLMACTTAASVGTIECAEAAKVITVPRATHVAARASHPRAVDERRVTAEPYYGGAYYYARPLFYIPAPFPLGFDFGFGW